MRDSVKEQVLEPLPGQWWVEQSKEEPIKRASSRRRKQQEAEAKATYQQGIDTFKRAFSACMDARGCSITESRII